MSTKKTAAKKSVSAVKKPTGIKGAPRTVSSPGGPPGSPSPSEIWKEGDVWKTLQTIIGGQPPVAKSSPMGAVLLRISASLLAQRINTVFFPPPYQSGRLSTATINACATAGGLHAVVCRNLSVQNRLLP